MQLVDARRLTGPNLLARIPLVVIEVSLSPDESVPACGAAIRAELSRGRAAVGVSPDVELAARPHKGGAVFSYEAPIDVMLAHAEMAEWAALSAIEVLGGNDALPLEPKLSEVAAMLERDANPRMLALQSEARRRGHPFLWDDTKVSVGAGRGAITFPRDAIPAVEEVAWDKVASIPIALITGTNGKTTSSRLLARIAQEAGFAVGSTSTDGLTVGGQTIDKGDWTGPAAARSILRRTDVDFAVLETARGGILRRGLAMDECDAALVTNVSDDHLGDYGIDDIAAMARVKAVTAAAVRPGGTIVYSAHDPSLVELAREAKVPVVFFADLDRADTAAEATIGRHVAGGGSAVVARAGALAVLEPSGSSAWMRIDEAPITSGGLARYNVENVLGVTAMARALGIPSAAITRAIRSFGPADNPGRGQVVEKDGVKVMLDFGHNPEGVRAVLRLVSGLRGEQPAGSLAVITGSAGDRSDREIDDIARAVAEGRPDRVFVRDLPHYLRGRAVGEVPRLFEESFVRLGIRSETAASEVDALKKAFALSSAGDFIVVLVHLDHDEVAEFLAAPSGPAPP